MDTYTDTERALMAAAEASNAATWVANDVRNALRMAVRDAYAYGTTEAAIVKATGLPRSTVRTWVGK